MPTSDTNEPGSIEIDPADAKAAYEALLDVLAAISHKSLVTPRIDMQRAGAHAFGLAERDSVPDRAAAFEKLVVGEVLAPRPLDRYKQAALATWYTRQQQLRFAARSSGTVPSVVAEEATAIKRRMLKILSHYFEDHRTYGIELAAIRAGQGYQDMANDLQQLAELYETPDIKAIVSRDPMHYVETDPRDARRLGGEIFRALGFESRETAEWTERMQRAYTHLSDTYTEHCYAGGLLFFRTENVELTYPTSLVSVVRSNPTRAKAESGSTEAATETEQAADTTEEAEAEREDETS